MMIPPDLLRNLEISLPPILLGSELTRDMTTKGHFADLKDILAKTYQEDRSEGNSRLSSGLNAVYEALLYDLGMTEFKWSRHVTDFLSNMIKEPDYFQIRRKCSEIEQVYRNKSH